MRDTDGAGLTPADRSTSSGLPRPNLKLQVNSIPPPPRPPPPVLRQQQPAQRVNGVGLSHTVPSSASSPARSTSRDAASVKKRICARCAAQLGRFFNKGSPCPTCGQKTCSNCRVRLFPDRKKPWMCTFCVKERQSPRKNPGDFMQRRNSVLKRKPHPVMLANEALLTMPRSSKHSPVSNRVSYNGSLPRNFTALSDPPMDVGDYYTATRGRPVATPHTPNARKRAPPIPIKSFQVITKPAAEIEPGKYQSATLGKPVKNLISPMAARRWEETAEVVTTLRRSKPAPPVPGGAGVVIKEKYFHVEVNSVPSRDPRAGLVWPPKPAAKDGAEAHPKLLNGTAVSSQASSSRPKAATIDRVPLRRYTTAFTKDTPPISADSFARTQDDTALGEASNLSAATLPRTVRQVQRNESLKSTSSAYMNAQQLDQAISLLNLAQSSSETLTKPQPGLGHHAGLRHPSYATFSRSDSRRKSFMERGSLRRSASFKLDSFLYKEIYNEIAMDYDDFLTVVKTHLKETAEWYLRLQNEPVQSGLVRGFSLRRKVALPARRSSIPNTSFVVPFEGTTNPYDLLLTSELASPDRSQPRAPWTLNDERFQEHLKEREKSVSNLISTLDFSTDPEPVRTLSKLHPLIRTFSSGDEVPGEEPEAGFSGLQRHVSIIEIRPTSPSGSTYSSDSANAKNVFEVTEILPDVEIVLQEAPAKELRTAESSRRGSTNSVDLPANGEPNLLKPSSTVLRVGEEDIHRAVSPPLAFQKSPEVKPRKSLMNGLHKITPTSANDLPVASTVSTHSSMFTGHVQAAQTEISSILNGMPKLREVSKLPPVVAPKKPQDDGIAELQRVLGSLRASTKPPEAGKQQFRRSDSEDDSGNEVQKVSAAIEHFKKVNEEVQDLKDFLKTVRQGAKITVEEPAARNGFTVHTPQLPGLQIDHHEQLPAPAPVPVSEPSVIVNNEDAIHQPTDHYLQREANQPPVVQSSSLKAVNRPNSIPTFPYSTAAEINHIGSPNHIKISHPTTLEITQSDLSVFDGKENRQPERPKWHSNLLDSPSYHTTSSADEHDFSPTTEEPPKTPVKKCVPASPRARFFSPGSTDSEDEERPDYDYADDESVSSAFSDDGALTIPTVKACRRVDAEHEELDPVETWDVVEQPPAIDFIPRQPVPLDCIEEESEDDDTRESRFTKAINNRRAMRPVVSLDLSPDEAEEAGGEEATAWNGGDGQSDLEQYFITGLLQSNKTADGKAKPGYYRDELDFDAMEEEEEEEVKLTKEPSIFGSARLKFAGPNSNDYRLSSDMDDLSLSGPSDDESFY